VKVISQTTVSLLLPETGSTYPEANYKELQHTFQHVFDDRATQKEVYDHVALPLVSNLIHGKVAFCLLMELLAVAKLSQ
jgi:kinesin family protein 23